jgi:hypothetical protein
MGRHLSQCGMFPHTTPHFGIIISAIYRLFLPHPVFQYLERECSGMHPLSAYHAMQAGLLYSGSKFMEGYGPRQLEDCISCEGRIIGIIVINYSYRVKKG